MFSRVNAEGTDFKCREPIEMGSTRQEEYISAWELRLNSVPSFPFPLCLNYLILGVRSGGLVAKGLYWKRH